MHVDQPGLNAFALQDFGCDHGFGQQGAGGNDRDIVAFLHNNPFADLERIVFVHQNRHFRAADLDIYRTDVRRRRMDGLDNIDRIPGIYDRHTGNGPDDGDIIQRLVGGSQIGVGQSGAAAHHLDILPHVADIIAKHFKRTGRHKGSDGGKKRNFTRRGQPGGEPHDSLLHDAELKMAIGKFFLEGRHSGAARTVGRKGHNVGIVLSRLDQRFSKSFSRIP